MIELDQLLQQISLWEAHPAVYILLILLIMLEGTLVTLVAGMAAAAGLLHPGGVFAAVIGGNLMSDLLWYSAGRMGLGGWFGRKQPHLINTIQHNTTRLVLTAKLTTGIAIPTLIATGAARIPYRKWFPVAVVGEIVWSGALVLIGYTSTETIIHAINTGLGWLGPITFIIAAAALYIWYKHNPFGKRLAMSN